MTYLIKNGYWKALKMFIAPFLPACMHTYVGMLVNMCAGVVCGMYMCVCMCVCMHLHVCMHVCVCMCVCVGYACAHVCDIISENKCMYAHVHELIIYKFICKDIIQCKKYACFEMRQITQKLIYVIFVAM